jgi:phosphomannomutase
MEFCQKNPPARLAGSPVERLVTFDGVKMIAKDGSWLMLRGSGTEPILRIYAESKTPASAQKLIRDGVGLTKRV